VLTGSIDIDTLNGTFVSSNINVLGESPNYTILSDITLPDAFVLTNGITAPFSFLLLDGTSFIGFSGGSVDAEVFFGCDASAHCSSASPDFSATLVAAVPEPSTWAMMILGFVGVGAMTYRRRKNVALAA
jgi:hypothetical protein